MQPFKKEEVEALIKACDFSQEAVTDRRRKFIMPRPTAKRDKAMLLTLLDTGLRAGELCALRIADVEMRTGRVHVRPGEAGKAKGGKGRIVYLGKSARRFLWRYLAELSMGWAVRQAVRERLRVMVKRILRKYGYPPDMQEKATQTVLEQAALIGRDWAE